MNPPPEELLDMPRWKHAEEFAAAYETERQAHFKEFRKLQADAWPENVEAIGELDRHCLDRRYEATEEANVPVNGCRSAWSSANGSN